MSADRLADVPQHVLDYMDEHNALTLATAARTGVPHATTLLYVNDGATIYVWTRPQSRTARHVEQNPTVSFTIDDQAEDPAQTRGVQGTGECQVVLNGEEIALAAKLFGDSFPTLSTGSSTAGISFFRIRPAELEFIDNTGAAAEREGQEFGAEYRRELVYSVFGDLPAQRGVTMTGRLQNVQVEEGEVIVRQGGPADKFFIIVDGEVEVVRDEDGRSETLATLTSGQFFGELAIMRDQPRAATVRAAKPTTLLTMDRDAFHEVVAGSLGVSDDFDQVIQERLGAGEPS